MGIAGEDVGEGMEVEAETAAVEIKIEVEAEGLAAVVQGLVNPPLPHLPPTR